MESQSECNKKKEGISNFIEIKDLLSILYYSKYAKRK